jgi:sterol desaturase/sphingolipid hydroxylase (fatty acid hydroxylase superfamily)
VNLSQSGLLTAAVVAGVFALASATETFWPLRLRRVEPRGLRVLRNLSVAGVAFAVTELLQIPILVPVAAWVRERGFGLLNLVGLPPWLRLVLGVVLLDYTLWFWHWANHRLPLLWRFHLVHHVDLDMDASTALRFHFGELGLSVFFRALQVAALGASPQAVALWELLLFASILFHHSNTRLPFRLERLLVGLIVTPRMHGIHHMNRSELTNSNWSSLLSIWDFLHGTFRFEVSDQGAIGVPAYSDPREVTWARLMTLPFRRQRDDWRAR